MKLKNILRVILVTAGLLLIPLIAMQFTSEVNWTLSDFVFAGVLIGGTGLVYEAITYKERSAKFKIITGIVLFLILAVVWVELAVGIFD